MEQFFDGIAARLQELFDPEVVGAKVGDLLANLIIALVVFCAFYILWWVLRRLLRPLFQRTQLDQTAIAFMETILKYSVLAIGVVSALGAVGIDTSAVLTSLGIVGLTIGFAARDALSNLISGILIFVDRPFVIGDLVEIEGHYGRVEQITLRSTRIVTSDGKMLAVPNAEIINKTVASYTNFPHLRLDVGATVGVNENLEEVRRLLIGIVAEDPEYLQEPAPRVVITQLNDYNVALELQAWIQNERRHVEMRSDLRERVFNTLTRAGVDMPFETIQIHPMEVKLLDGDSGREA
jgi:small conductance mechanosensitive channel